MFQLQLKLRQLEQLTPLLMFVLAFLVARTEYVNHPCLHCENVCLAQRTTSQHLDVLDIKEHMGKKLSPSIVFYESLFNHREI